MTERDSYNEARLTIEQMGLIVKDDASGRIVMTPGKPVVVLSLTIIASDETVLVDWRTLKGVEVARPIRLAIDKNLPALLAALVAVEVDA